MELHAQGLATAQWMGERRAWLPCSYSTGAKAARLDAVARSSFKTGPSLLPVALCWAFHCCFLAEGFNFGDQKRKKP